MAEGTTANGVFGAKVMWHQMPDLLAKLTAVHGARRRSDRALLQRTFPRLRFVWIWREEVVAQAVSFARALQTDEWTATAQRRLAGTPRFDFDQIHRLLREVIEHNEAWERWFAHNGIRPFRIRYEDLSQDMNGVTHGLLAFLGLELPDGKVIEPKHDRQADHTNAEWVDRYRAIALT